jgi:hypothetical protein
MRNLMAPGTVDALLFDVGGVVVRIDFNRAFARWLGYLHVLGARQIDSRRHKVPSLQCFV